MLQRRVGILQATREGFRRGQAAYKSRQERASLEELGAQPARLSTEFQKLSPAELLKHFQERTSPKFFSGFEIEDAWAQSAGGADTLELMCSVRLLKEHRWPLAGFGEKSFGDPINWHRDPLSEKIWPLDYHGDIPLWHNDGSDIRALWELNRLGHLIKLGRVFQLTEFGRVLVRGTEFPFENQDFDEEFFLQVESWQLQNPLGRGANWACAMEVALRAMNLLGAFALFKSSPKLTAERLLLLLKMFDQHGAHIRRNLEFSYIATSNHYLSDVAGLLWLGLMLPELQAAEEWKMWAADEMLRELDKQIMPDGAHYEGSTGYHAYVLELFLHSLVLCRQNHLDFNPKYSDKLKAMLDYQRVLLRPDGLFPLIGDSDGSRVLPIQYRDANDRGYLLPLGGVAFGESRFMPPPAEGLPPELEMVSVKQADSKALDLLRWAGAPVSSQAFPDAGTYVLREKDLYLTLNGSGAQAGRPTSHKHNDVLSIEVSAGGRAFIVDPGTYVYTADLHERHLFRSTSYHSTIQIDNEEQQTIREDEPFKNGAEARVRVLSWETSAERDWVVAEHSGYRRLPEPVTHRRTVTFDKLNRLWLIEDQIDGRGEHLVLARFHFDAGLDVAAVDERSVVAKDLTSGAQLVVCALPTDEELRLTLEPQFVSRSYGSKLPSITACWSMQTSVPCKLSWAIVPVHPKENLEERLNILRSPKSNVQIGQVV